MAINPRAARANVTQEELGAEYKLGEYIARGAYAKVYAATRVSDGMPVAVKKILLDFPHKKRMDMVVREIRILRMLAETGSPCVVKLLDIIQPKNAQFDSLILVFERAETDLARLAQQKLNFSELHVQFWLFQLLAAIQTMGSAGLMHRGLCTKLR